MFKHLGLIVALCIIGTCGQSETPTTESSTPVPDTSLTSSIETTSIQQTTTVSESVPTSSIETTPAATSTPAATTTSAHETTSIVTTSTHESSTVPTVAPTTAAPATVPPPTKGTWVVIDKVANETCIKAQLAVQFQINYNEKNYKYDLMTNATSDESTCHGEESGTQVLSLQDGDYKLTFIFANDSKTAFVKNISLSIPDVAEVFETSDQQYFTAHTDKSYQCNSQTLVKLPNVTFEFYDLQLQSFMHGEKDFSQAEDCANDDRMNDIVPISVAVALCVMVIIILIGYLVTRRKSRQRGYQSV